MGVNRTLNPAAAALFRESFYVSDPGINDRGRTVLADWGFAFVGSLVTDDGSHDIWQAPPGEGRLGRAIDRGGWDELVVFGCGHARPSMKAAPSAVCFCDVRPTRVIAKVRLR